MYYTTLTKPLSLLVAQAISVQFVNENYLLLTYLLACCVCVFSCACCRIYALIVYAVAVKFRAGSNCAIVVDCRQTAVFVIDLGF